MSEGKGRDLLGFSRTEWLASGLSEWSFQALRDCASRGGGVGLGFETWVELAQLPNVRERMCSAFPRDLLERLVRELHEALQAGVEDSHDLTADLALIQRLQQLLYPDS